MLRIGWLGCLTAAVVFGGVNRASASPMRLEILGSTDALYIPSDDRVKIDVTDGFSKYTIGGGGRVLEHNWEREDWKKPIDAGMNIYAALFDGDRYLGQKLFQGDVTGTLSYWGSVARFGADAHGFSEGEMRLSPGVDPSLIPSWFTGLTATVDSSVGGGYVNWYSTRLTLAVAPVPEPSSVLVFLAAVGFVGYRRHRARGSAGASPSR